MPKTLPYLMFIHDGRANYPQIKALMNAYKGRFTMEECTFNEALTRPYIGEAICWHMMGFYLKKLPSALTIHDYRSLSVGRGRWLKDKLKFFGNAKPDIRIFQPSIVNQLNFRDSVPSYLMDVALTDSIVEQRNAKHLAKEYDYCYIGAMKAERRMETMIDSFLERFGAEKTLVLVGEPEAYLLERYKDKTNIVFTGKRPQQEVFEIIRKSHATVAFFPNHFPHIVQTPTKLLEYAALGARIIANEQPMNREKAKQFSIKLIWGHHTDMFAAAPDSFDWPDNMDTDPVPMLWRTQLKESGVEALVNSWLN